MTRGARAESDEDAMEVGVSEEILEKGAWTRDERRREARERVRASERSAKGAAHCLRFGQRGASDD